jgi:hypothetical protein
MSRFFPVIVAVVLTGSFGLMEGWWTHRWVSSTQLELASERVASIPMNLGEWKGKDREIDARELKAAQIQGYVSRLYVNQSTGTTVSVLLVCGRPGPVSVHTPDVCYQGAGYGVAAAPAKHTIAGGEFWVANFRRLESPTPEPLRVYWSWNAGDGWQATDNPRLRFASKEWLYKLYVIRALNAVDDPVDIDPVQAFVQVLLPQLQKDLFTP